MAEFLFAKFVFAVELRNKIRCPNNWPCNQLRKKTQVKTEIEEITHRLYLFPIYINQIAYCLKRVKRNTNR